MDGMNWLLCFFFFFFFSGEESMCCLLYRLALDGWLAVVGFVIVGYLLVGSW